MGFFNDVWLSLSRKDPAKKIKWYWKSDQEMPHNIYHPGIKTKDHIRKFHWIHYFFKTKFLVPIMYVLEKALGNHVEKEVRDVWHNSNLKIFDRAFDEAILDFYCHYLVHMWDQKHVIKGCDSMEELREKAKKVAPKLRNIRVLYSMKRVMQTMVLNDTAYKEFFNMLMFRLYQESQKSYKNHKKLKHVLYHSRNMFDIDYFIIGKHVHDSNEFPAYAQDMTKVNKK